MALADGCPDRRAAVEVLRIRVFQGRFPGLCGIGGGQRQRLGQQLGQLALAPRGGPQHLAHHGIAPCRGAQLVYRRNRRGEQVHAPLQPHQWLLVAQADAAAVEQHPLGLTSVVFKGKDARLAGLGYAQHRVGLA